MLTDQNHEAAPGFCAPSMPLWNCTYLWIYNKRWHEPNLITHDPETMFFWIYFTILESKRTKKTWVARYPHALGMTQRCSERPMNSTIKTLPNHSTTSSTSTAITILNKYLSIYPTTWTPWENVSRKSKKLWWWNHGTWWRRILGSWVSSFSWSKLLQLSQTLFLLMF